MALGAIYCSPFDYETKKALANKVLHPELFCKSWGCVEPRKKAPSNPQFKQSRYCEKCARIAKANAIYMGNPCV